jgi:hypothetical protein
MCRSATPRGAAFRKDHTDFFDASLAPGGGPLSTKRKKPNSRNSKFQKLQTGKNKNLKTFIAMFSARSISKLFPARFLFFEISGKAFSSSALDVLCSVRNVRAVYLMVASSVPMKRRHLPG